MNKTGKAHVLIVDDNEDILFMLKTMLQLKDYSVTIKESAENIEAFIQELMPDLILMDMLLSGIDGTDVCRNLKQDPTVAAIPIVMISALPQAGEKCLKAGANFFIGKPFEMNDFLNVVATALIKTPA
ncbi:MAG: response regulator [Ferruginibacter sp.]